jgi:hypothetical protein
MFGKKTDEQKMREQIQKNKKEREKYSRQFFIEIISDWGIKIVEKDIDEKTKQGFEPVSISNLSYHYASDDLAILYKRKEA